MMNQIRIKTSSRLHFGLLGLDVDSRRQFGGLGLMIEDPGLELTIEPAERWEAIGPQSHRALTIARNVATQLDGMGNPLKPLRVEIVHTPEPHVGLGVGTQLSLAIARALTLVAGLTEYSPQQLAELTGRGNRSGIGIHGFAGGGLIVDAGRRGEEIPTRVIRASFPVEWSILLVRPDSLGGLHGSAEREAFHQLPPIPQALTDHLCRVGLLDLIPAVIDGDLPEFGRALEEVQEIVGKCFAPVQGGAYSSPIHRDIVKSMRDCGLVGVGQSSWGPTLYGFTTASRDKQIDMHSRLKHLCKLSDERISWTHASNQGAKILIG